MATVRAGTGTASTITRPRRRVWLGLAFVHRWLGIAGCLLFVSWFVSGIAMVYVRMPELGPDERLAHAPRLRVDALQVAPADAARRAGRPDLSSLELGMLGDRVVYRFGGRAPRVVFADTGESVPAVTRERAESAARAYVGASVPLQVTPLDAPDQWTLQLRPHFPLQRVVVGDANRTDLYVSNATGDVVLDTTRRERLLAYVGPVAHWLYLPVLRRDGERWTRVILWSSGLGLVLCLSGLVAGVWRLSFRRGVGAPDGRSMSPYRGWLRWHHCAGLLFGVVTFTWTFSGLLSMGPFAWLSHDGLQSQVEAAVRGRPVSALHYAVEDVRAAASALGSAIALKEMRLVTFMGRDYWLGIESEAVHRLVSAGAHAAPVVALARADVEAAARAAAGDVAVELTWLDGYDAYYYDPKGQQPLPVLRARLADATSTWFYVDPGRGDVALAVGRRDRMNRWLYHGLHSLDPAWLRKRRPLWDVVVVALSLGGLAGAITSLVPAWRRLRALARR